MVKLTSYLAYHFCIIIVFHNLYIFCSVAQLHQIQYLHIEEGATGYSYYSVFKMCLDDGDINWVELEDPYIRANHQV